MKNKTLILMVLCTICFACSKQNDDGNIFTEQDFKGTIELSSVIENSASTVTRAEDWSGLEEVDGKIILPEEIIPSTDDFLVEITGEYIIPDADLGVQVEGGPKESYSLTGLTLKEYSSDVPYLYAGDYSIVLSYGDAAEEGYGKPYFYKKTDFKVVARKSIEESISLNLSNSIVREIQTTESFNNYYTSAEFKITTSKGTELALNPGEKTLFFVQPETTLTLSGKATKTNGVEVAFSGEIGTTSACECYTIVVDAGNIGNSNIQISFDGNTTQFPVVNTDIEINTQK